MTISREKISDNHGHWRAWVWLCPWTMLGLAAASLFVLGWSLWTAVLAAMLLACPAIILWGALQSRRRNQT